MVDRTTEVPPPLLVAMLVVIRVAVLVGTLVACEASGPPGARADAVPPAARLAAANDSAAGDSAALAALPPTLVRELGVRDVLTPGALRDTARVSCETLPALPAPDTLDTRRRLRAVLADSARTVLFVRAARSDGALRRVELVRREPRAGQRGFIWDAERDAVQSIVWTRPGAPRPEVTELPRGGPVPRALRALGRRLLALPCPPARPAPRPIGPRR
jgi:hypothetical protein